jgi:mono/diheme cytochrome c family protein
MYATLCAHCHGPEATGYAADRAPSLVNPTFLESANDLFLHLSIEHGRPGTSMAAYGKSAGGPLSPAAIDRRVDPRPRPAGARPRRGRRGRHDARPPAVCVALPELSR